ncbi:hypothetical protein FISHEDRAFT_73137 [Fistulina hepatica ATCC 64428]|uniref:Uncharacterized protein n=1 Tax=Fistulina hepatica ATCC 64428 TaxID=1128425 RepID=A0A0D7AD62_9AGAR|nr:hypothetical protein FISHEDRAFT_73137 [Fistulina hepatica ATCC 64428]
MRDCGQVIPTENCWYGYECRTQTHKLAHATRLNVSDHPTSNQLLLKAFLAAFLCPSTAKEPSSELILASFVL